MIVTIFKATEMCNSNCIYCGVIKKSQQKIMDFNLLELILHRINEYLIDNPKEQIDLTWHGGEVCLLGADYFYKAIELINKFCPNTKDRLLHSVQSNLTLLNQEIIDAFKILGIKSIGSSFEYIPNIRGFGKDRNSTEYNKRFFHGANLLEKNGMKWAVIYVVNQYSLKAPIETFNILTNLNVDSPPTFNRIYLYGKDEHCLSITGEEFADFLGSIFPVWYNSMDRYGHVDPFYNIYRSYRTRKSHMGCEFSGNCSHRWLYIGPTGETSQCGRSGEFGILPYGNIKVQSFEQLLKREKRDDFLKRQIYLKNTVCKKCRFWNICNGGCPLDAIMSHGEIMNISPLHCDWLKPFITKYFEPITGFKF